LEESAGCPRWGFIFNVLSSSTEEMANSFPLTMWVASETLFGVCAQEFAISTHVFSVSKEFVVEFPQAQVWFAAKHQFWQQGHPKKRRRSGAAICFIGQVDISLLVVGRFAVFDVR
jgi:hypothetical protein